MPASTSPASPVPPSAAAVNLRIVSAVLLTFICYLSIGIPLGVLPGYIHADLGYSSFIAGLGISMQYIATLVTRPYGGRSADRIGPKKTVQRGLLLCLASGVCMAAAALLHGAPGLSLLALIASRMTLGFAESMIGTGAISWGIGSVGAQHTPRVISWNGIASYSAIAIGAPLGVAMEQHWGFISLGVMSIVMPLLGYLLARRKPDSVTVAHGETLAFMHVLMRVLPYGIALGLGTIGFGAIATFITLYYASFGWADAAYCLSAFGAAFVASRLLFSHTIHRFGGFRVAMVLFPIEIAGLLLIWLAPGPLWAMLGAALTGLGFSMIFPALAVEAVALVPSRNRGAAIGAYTVFFDIALGVTGPAAGLIIAQMGYPSVYLFAAVGTLLALAIVIRSSLQPRTAPLA